MTVQQRSGAAERAEAEAYVDRVNRRVAHRMLQLLEASGDIKRRLEDFPADPSELADQMVALVPVQRNALDERIGPFYDTSGVRALLKVGRRAIDDRRRRGTILAVRTSDKHWLYPTFQFDGAALRPEVLAVLRAFRDVGVGRWTVAAWFTTPAEDLGGRTPVECLNDRLDEEAVHELASSTARRWAG